MMIFMAFKTKKGPFKMCYFKRVPFEKLFPFKAFKAFKTKKLFINIHYTLYTFFTLNTLNTLNHIYILLIIPFKVSFKVDESITLNGKRW